MKLWLTGGFVRDHLMGERTVSHDLDFSVEAESYDAMRTALLQRGVHIWQERPEFVTIRGRITLDRLGKFGGLLHADMGRGPDNALDVDFTLCRQESMYSDGRHPDNVTPATVHVDLARRDFTANAVAVSEDGVWLDPHKGKLHCSYRMLDTVGRPEERFREDSLRMLRAFRFSVTRSMCCTERVVKALNDESLLTLLKTLPVERVQGEMYKAFKHDWMYSAQLLTFDMGGLGVFVKLYFPNLWFKATLEAK